ncbi:MAG: recombinase family protein [Burkholderiales bacterium]|nr:recombinase family protein [Burkholderiales bacterium]
MTNRAVCYLRSSKDRNDVSIDAQRRALHDLAGQRGLIVVGEYADAVESGKDDDRPGFQRLLRDLRAPGRQWEHILALDTARIARRQMLALIFDQECERAGVRLVFRTVPDAADPITVTLLKSILRAMDEWHSLTSRQKGLAGMAENVRQGWRAGGRAPRGYRLEYHATGAIRDGQPVMKSRLVPDESAHQVAAYLRARAAGEMRGQIMWRLGVDWPVASLNGMEWAALVYAGHTVWNVHAERERGASKTGTRRRPRPEWMIQRSTHEPLITDEEAEAILGQLERQRAAHTRADASQYLLTGLLVTPDGQAWAGDSSDAYRLGKGRRIAARRVDEPVLEQVFSDLDSEETAKRVVEAMRDLVAGPVDGRALAGLEKRIAGLTTQIGRTVDLAARLDDPDPVLRRVTELEAERSTVAEKLAELRQRQSASDEVATMGVGDVRAAFRTLRQEMVATNRAALRPVLPDIIERIVLDPASLDCEIRYRVTGVSMASRRGFEPLYRP